VEKGKENTTAPLREGGLGTLYYLPHYTAAFVDPDQVEKRKSTAMQGKKKRILYLFIGVFIYLLGGRDDDSLASAPGGGKVVCFRRREEKGNKRHEKTCVLSKGAGPGPETHLERKE